MPTFRITAPDGRTFNVTGPDGSTAEQALAQVQAQYQQPQPAAKGNGAVPLESLGAGLGKGFGQVVLGAQGLVGQGIEALGGMGQEKSITDLIVPSEPNLVQKAGQWLQQDATQGRAKLEAELAPFAAENPIAAGAGELGGQLIATAPVGGALGAAAKSVGLTKFGTALASSGMKTGAPAAAGVAAKAADLGIRTAGGAATGGASAALIDPEQAAAGAVVGGALPGALKAAGAAGQAIGKVVRGPVQTPEMVQAVQAARAAGYVVPPSQANASLKNRLLEGFAGKISTAQNASAANQSVTNRMAAQALGLPNDVPITPASLKQVRDIAGQSYDAVAQTGTIKPTAAYESALKSIEAPFMKAAQGFPNAKPSPVIDLVESLRSPSFDAASAVEKIKHLRSAADDAFRTGNTDVARASKAAAKALEDAVETHVAGLGSPQLLNELREARQLIAKTYSVEKALNPATGTIDAKQLAAQLKRGKPLSGELKEVADFAGRFPKAAQTPEAIGSLPQFSPLDWSGATLASLMAGNAAPMLAVGARPAARALALAPVTQNRLVQSGFRSLLPPEQVRQLMYQTAPIAAAQ